MVFALLALPVGAVLIALTGAGDSPYVPFVLLLVIVTVYTPRTADAVVVASATAVALVAAIILGTPSDRSEDRLPVIATHLLVLATYAFVAAAVGRALRQARSAITARAETLAGERSDAMRLAFTDALTGLYNRRYAEDLLPRLVADAKRGRLFSVLALDLDGLKRINDTYGHDAGDRAIARIGEILRLSLRGADVAIRLGGDEFVALLPGTRADQARNVGERIRTTMASADWSDVGRPVSITYGAAEWHDGDAGADVLKAADASLYEAKRSRR
jgi:diguanylate cyclase (GGDEF)-like protein